MREEWVGTDLVTGRTGRAGTNGHKAWWYPGARSTAVGGLIPEEGALTENPASKACVAPRGFRLRVTKLSHSKSSENEIHQVGWKVLILG